MLGHQNGHVVIYEQLCQNSSQTLQGVFDHLGLERHEQTEQFLEFCQSTSQANRAKYGELATNSYFSVFRDPVESANKWRTELTPAQQESILELVSDSPAYQYGVQQGVWESSV